MLTRNTKIGKQIIVFLIAAVCFFAVLFSFSCISRCRNHICTGQDCPICALVNQAERSVKQISSGAISGAGILLTAILSLTVLMTAAQWVAGTSLISCKIRMNN
ncbi:MAG: hypothetical protein LUF30_06730 [Lachnospiraceae bacterium]|nr:hypothetical protein [Lachnospiraceae bacterium]